MALSNTVLTGLTRAATNRDSSYIADFVAPPCVPKRAEKVPGSSDWKATARRVGKYENIQIPSRGLARAAHTPAVQGSSTVEDYEITVGERSFAVPFDTETGGPEMDTSTVDALESNTETRRFSSMIRIDRETEVASILKNTSVMTQGLDAAGALWTDPTVNPIKQMKTGAQAVLDNGLEYPTRLVFSLDYWYAFTENANVQAIFGDNPMKGGVAEFEEHLSNLLYGFNPDTPKLRIRVASSNSSTTNPGQTARVVGQIYQSHFAMLHVPEDVGAGDYVDLLQPSAIKQYEAFEMYVDSFENEETKSLYRRVQEGRRAEVFDATLGYCIRNAV